MRLTLDHLYKRVIGGWQRRWQIIFSVALLVFNFAAPAVAQKPHAILPQVFIDTSWNPPVGGHTWPALTSAQFTSALQSAQPGDIIVLDAGTLYTGNFVVPAKANPNGKWIYIESSALSNLPPPRTRVSPPDAGNMPKIVTPNATNAIRFQDGANYWRFVGIEIYSASTYQPPGYTPGVFFGYALVDKFSYPGTSNIPDHIFFDRCYVHGDSTHDVQQGIVGNDTYFAVVDSYISDIHAKYPTETQAVVAYTTPGPIKLVNNHLEATTENVMFGGAGRGAFGFVPSDIEVRDNYFYKPLSWVPLSVATNTYTVKNAFEIKSGQRVLFNNNVIKNNWSAAQNGFAIVLTVRTIQSGDVAVVNDITITNNKLKNVVGGINTSSVDGQCVLPNCTNAGSQDRWDIINNLIEFYDPTLPGGARNFGILLNGGIDNPGGGVFVPLRDVVFQHNTMIPAASTPCFSSVYFSVPSLLGSPPFSSNVTNNIWLLDNVMCKQPTGDWGLQGTSGLTQYMGTPSTPPDDLTQRFFGNVMFVPPGNSVATFPPHNLATTVPLIYFNPPRDNFQLLLAKWTDTTDGLIAGITNSSLPVSFLP